MYDFLGSDIKRTYPDIVHHSSIILVEATDHLLSAFDQKLSGYVTDLYKKRPAMTVYTGTTVKQLSENVATFGDGRKVKFGACVWSTGYIHIPYPIMILMLHASYVC
jgi:NADH dehydrogenase FAD-containing subunit